MNSRDFSVPSSMKEKYEEITQIIKGFCNEKLNSEYEECCYKLCAAISRKRPSPLLKGKAETWACGIVHAIGTVNLLFDKNQHLNVRQCELYKYFGVSETTGAKKSKDIRDLMKMYQTIKKWTLPSKIDENPNLWMISVNGFVIDARHAPFEIQQEAYRRGLIPYLPEAKSEYKNKNIIEFPTKAKQIAKQYTQESKSSQNEQIHKAEAEELIYQAWDADDKEEAVELAIKALELWPDCADAYFILADEVDDIYEAKELFEEAVKAGERALGNKKFMEYTGSFWIQEETRPYMRARFQLAGILWVLDKKEAAAEHFKDMLLLNPNDNQGVRHYLINWLLDIGDYDGFEKIMSDYNKDTYAGMKYSRALYLYSTGKLTDASDKLREAMKANIFVTDYLLGSKRLPEMLPELIGRGDENEAIFYASEAYDLWHNKGTAIPWLRKEERLFKSNISK